MICDVLLAEDAGIPLLSTSLWRCSGDSVLLELGENMWTHSSAELRRIWADMGVS